MPQPDTPAPEPLLEVRDLAVSFAADAGWRQAVAGVNLSVYPGQTLAVVGESGCGKSVTAMSLLQLLPRSTARIDRGQAWLAGRTPGAPRRDLLAMGPKEIRSVRGADIAMIFQEPMTSLNPVFTIGEQIIEAVLLHQRAPARQAWATAVEALTAVGISEPDRRMREYPHEFSGGMRQRVMIAMALACRPRLLIADEPTTALDVTIQAQVLDLLASLRRTRALSILLITHALGVVAQHADVACVVYAGRVVEYAAVADLLATPLHPYTRALLACAPRVGSRVTRLPTVGEAVVAQISSPVQATRGQVHPWWIGGPPVAARPDGGRSDAPLDYALQEVRPGHWLGVWAAPGGPDGPPRVAHIRAHVPARSPTAPAA